MAAVDPQIEMKSVVRWSGAPVSAEVGSELVLMHLERGRCYGLGPIGSDLWRKLEEPVSVEELVAQLQTQYEAEPGRIEQDVLETLHQYAVEGLITVERPDDRG